MNVRVEALAERAAGRWRDRIAERLRAVGGVSVAVEPDGVAVAGQGLRARWLKDARLRWIGGWA